MLVNLLPLIIISIHAPAKGATRVHRARRARRAFQSTLPRRERRSKSRLPSPFVNFNPRSREGSDYLPFAILHRPFYFNPRSREGSDSVILAISAKPQIISIHAPAKGATAKITKTIPDDFHKINNCNNSFA